MSHEPIGATEIRLAEVIAALSMATDLAMGQPLEFALCSCVVAIRLGDALGLGETDLRPVYYQALLRYIGCNAESASFAAIVGDELALRSEIAAYDTGATAQIMSLILRHIRQANRDASALQTVRALAQGLVTSAGVFKAGFVAHCEVAQRLAARLGFEERILLALGQLYERWDGRGLPHGLRGEAVAPAVLLVALAQDAVTFQRLGGIDAALTMARERRGGAYDPRMVDCFCVHATQLFAGLEDEPSWEMVLGLEPAPQTVLTEAQLDAACQAIADFADIKSPYLLNHSSGVAALAAAAAQHCGLPAPDVVALRRAGWLHDVGRVGISAAIWGKPGPLSEREWEKVRLHAYYTERVLARPAPLARLGALAAAHHERLDGTGYHRALPAALLSPAARILAAADVYQALTEPRPHRPAYAPDAAVAELQREVRAGRLDGAAVAGVLAAAGHRVHAARPALVAGLSARQVEVLRLVARGLSMRQIAERLTISEKTVDNHIQHIYNKIGVSTRAGATLFAMEQDLLTAA